MDLDTFSQPSVLQLARAGDFRAIAYWLNTYLVPQNIYARVALDRPGWLLVMVEFFREPERDRLNRFICSRLVRLNSHLIEGVRVLGRVMGSADIRWDQSFRLSAAPAPNPVPPLVSTPRRRTQRQPMGRSPRRTASLRGRTVAPVQPAPEQVAERLVARPIRPRRPATTPPNALVVHSSRAVRPRHRKTAQRRPLRPVAVTLPRVALPAVHLPTVHLPTVHLPTVHLPTVHLPPISVELPRMDWPTVTLTLPDWQAWGMSTVQTFDAAMDATVQAFNITVDRLLDTAERVSPSQVGRMATTAAAVFLVGCGVELMRRLDPVALLTGTPTVTTPTGRIPVLRPASDLSTVPDPTTVTLAFSSESPFRVPSLHGPVPDAAPTPYPYPDVLLTRLDPPVLEDIAAEPSPLPNAGLTMVSVAAGNHVAGTGSADTPAAQIRQAIQTLEQQGLRPVGAGRNRREARQPEIVEVRGKRIAYLGYSDSDLQAASFWRAGTNPALEEQIAEDIDAIRSQVDWVVVNYRWGEALASFPSDRQMRLCRFAIDHGADLVVGYHPTVLQGAEIYKGRAIAYSLGDFIFQPENPDKSTSTEPADYDTAMLKVSLREEQMRLEFLPVQVKQNKAAIAPADKGQDILRYLEQASALFDQPLKTPIILDRQAPLPADPAASPSDAPAKSFTDTPADPGHAPGDSFIDYSTEEPLSPRILPSGAEASPTHKAPEPAKAISNPAVQPNVAPPMTPAPAAEGAIAPVEAPVPAADANLSEPASEAEPAAIGDDPDDAPADSADLVEEPWVEY
ncbi:Capsule biosynthesis protein CapA [Leptolyngbya sp. O-77]|nr:Capsule biosynthesis protein CapA [Leptolyngbya sp. O-77]